jgi:hypothetical protein
MIGLIAVTLGLLRHISTHLYYIYVDFTSVQASFWANIVRIQATSILGEYEFCHEQLVYEKKSLKAIDNKVIVSYGNSTEAKFD